MSSRSPWIAAKWPAPAGIIAGCTRRTGGVSVGKFDSLNLATHVGDDADHVADNRRRFLTNCALPGPPRWLNQVHGSTVVVDPGEDSVPEADAILSRKSGTVCAVLTADCLPVIFAAEDGGEIAVAHAGWRGLCNGILETTVASFSARPAMLIAWLGPAISQAAFEVGGEVRDAFVQQDPNAAACFVENSAGRWQADLYGLARQRLFETGVARVSGGNFCTYDDSECFFSYRRDGQCGRMASFVLRK